MCALIMCATQTLRVLVILRATPTFSPSGPVMSGKGFFHKAAANATSTHTHTHSVFSLNFSEAKKKLRKKERNNTDFFAGVSKSV